MQKPRYINSLTTEDPATMPGTQNADPDKELTALQVPKLTANVTKSSIASLAQGES